MEIKGFNNKRTEKNHLEKMVIDSFNELFLKYNRNGASCIVYGSDCYGEPKEFLSEKEEKIVVSVIQWLGSDVGHSFCKSIANMK